MPRQFLAPGARPGFLRVRAFLWFSALPVCSIMFRFFILLATPLLLTTVAAFGIDARRSASTVILDETGVKNLRIETVEAEEADFEEVIFALGRIEAIPSRTAAVSSRIAGRIIELKAHQGDEVKAGQEVARLESRQPGDPPSSIGLKAPIAGVVTRVEKRLGDPLEPDKALLEITDLSEVYAVARVPEHQAGGLKPGTVAHIKVAALPRESADGELLRFGTSADRQSGTIDAIFRLPNEAGLLRAEMRAEFSIVLSKRAGVVSLPRSALQGEPANRFVYVEDFELKHAFVKTQVQVGQMNDRFVEITNGLLPGDKVVTQGAYSLAFAGGGSVSLKAALDAAHGHEHNEDGSEMTPGDKARKAKAGEHGHAQAPESPLWKVVSGVLFVLLIVSLITRGRGAPLSKPAAEAREAS
jgi:multidrug efflux pump subunit AcrA (membrane-fusion protein)